MLHEAWVCVDEDLLQSIVLSPVKPTPPREVHHQIGSAADVGNLLTGLAVITTCVADIGPSIFKADDLAIAYADLQAAMAEAEKPKMRARRPPDVSDMFEPKQAPFRLLAQLSAKLTTDIEPREAGRLVAP